MEHNGTTSGGRGLAERVARRLRNAPVRMARGASMLLLLLSLPFAGGCVATPLPDPPSLDPPDLEMLYVTPTSVGPSVEITGMAGTLPADAALVGVNLDRTDAPVRVDADPDGGFSMTLLGAPGHVVRIHAERDDARSPPVDFVAAGGTPAAFVPPLADCLDIPVALALGRVSAGSMRTVSIPIANDCGADVRVDGIALRVPASGLSVRTTAPLTVPASGEAVVEVDVAPAAAGRVEEVLLVDIAAPEAGRRAVTLHGNAE
jgi:hypothetical protein